MKLLLFVAPYSSGFVRFTVPVVLGMAFLAGPTRAAAPGGVSLMETLSQWRYPESKMHGASMSDGGNPLIQSLKCRALLTTPDSVEKVIAFYSKLVEASPPPAGAEQKVKDADARSVSIQDDSEGRTITLRVLVVNKADTSTTLVISRTDGEKETHIVWVHYQRLGDNR